MSISTNYPIAADIHSFDQLNHLTHMNGVPISTIEERARPGKWSCSGFLDQNERLLDVMKKDWETVTSLGLTHVELAKYIDQLFSFRPDEIREFGIDYSNIENAKLPSLIAEMNKTQKSVFSRFFEMISIRASTLLKIEGIFNKIKYLYASFAAVYNHTFHSVGPSGIPHIKTQLRTKVDASSGCQDDIFCRTLRNGNTPTDGVVSGYWNTVCTVTNVDTGEEIVIGHGVREYIKRFGFYEGSVAYRVDPLKLISVLTGASVSSLQAYLREKASQ